MIQKVGNGIATVPPSTDHQNGDWIDTDIYEGELYLDLDTSILYTRVGSDIIKAGNASDNFANADLVFDATHTHNLGVNGVIIARGTGGIGSTTGVFLSLDGSAAQLGYDNAGSATEITVSSSSIGLKKNGTDKVIVNASGVTITDSVVKLTGIPTYADEAAATTGGLATDAIYKTSTGELRIKL